ncbi:unnamed protein product [Rotaria sordida]|uniref:Uncharacterized protein n=1 Tax=Rotaria sordida TaxID=392033 RepID=A0A815RXL1_9BILA|nr:unnamed protein product [Rotaria sordida]
MNRTIDIPADLIRNGKTLTIEKYSELFINGYHLSKPAKFVRQNNGICLVDSQQQDVKSGVYNHQFESYNDECYLIQLIIEFPGEILNAGKSVTIEKIDSNDDQLSGNIDDLYKTENINKSVGPKDIYIKVPKKFIERGKTVVVHKDDISITNSTDYHKNLSRRLISNKFAKRNSLQLKNMVEITIEVPPELFDDGQKITFRQENAQAVAGNFPYRRQSRQDIQVNVNDILKQDKKVSIEEFLSNKTWNPVLSDDKHSIKLSLNFTDRPDIKKEDQINIVRNQQNLRIETKDQQGFRTYRQITLPERTKLDEVKYQFDEKHCSLNVLLPLQ